ncbi:flavin reductase family protein [Segeticoccus rhizosphaerae]|uniref:flavin reductase family protein n=1 Tax=Segeticoccus rhizosphaerae TaxID=1104777 RepID=UPI001939D306|nr:flavin reductase family protein [Segeticoccus rhizosphaerae]
MGVDEFDPFVRGLDYPMFVVTSAHGGVRAGCLVGFVTQASIDPPRLLVCLSVENHTYRVAREASVLAVHVLASDQHHLAELFGGQTGDEVDKLEQCRWRPGPDGVPLLQDCTPRCVGRVLARHPLGDHVGFLIEPVVVEGDTSADVLTLQQCHDLSPGHPA